MVPDGGLNHHVKEICMDAERFGHWTRALSSLRPLSRRGASSASAGAVAFLALAGVAQSKKKKKKCKKCKTCQSVCPADANVCVDDVPWGCGQGCVCFTGTSGTMCGEPFSAACIACDVDADCDEFTGVGSACITNTVGCNCDDLPKACVAPCKNPLPVKLT
jgi:hypothetical protein